jgi:hypothetical protein
MKIKLYKKSEWRKSRICDSLQLINKKANGKIFLLLDQNRACSKMKSAQWGFSFTISNIHFLKQLCLYFNYMK